jgi:uncharacterized membrane protein
MDNLAQDSILAFASEAEAVKWLLTAFHEQGKEIIRLKEKVVDLEAIIDLRANGEAELRRRLASLEHREPSPSQESRGKTLLAILAANGGKMLLKDARRQMELDGSTFSRLLASMEDAIGSKDYRLDRRQSLIFIK